MENASDTVYESTKSRAMNGGDGRYSYARNSTMQRSGSEVAMIFIQNAILENLDVEQLFTSSKSFKIVDLGCSVGSNTIMAIENIINAVKLKQQSYITQSEDEINLEFQVFFNDHVSNDFNFLFKSLPSDKQYFAAGVPGPFQGRLFPKSSIHFFHSSFALHWLLTTPKELVDKNSLAYNKGRIHYNNSGPEVFKAYSSQFAKGIESFLNSRAVELVNGGMMAIVCLCIPDGISPSNTSSFLTTEILESCLLDMVKKGLISEDKVNSFNVPMYFPTSAELESLIKRNTFFDIKSMERLSVPKNSVSDLQPQEKALHFGALHVRAGFEGLIKEHFGNELSNQVFDMFTPKYVKSLISVYSSNKKSINMYLFILNRNFT